LVIPAGTRAAAPATRASTTGGRTYTVQQGDTYSSIAQKYGISYKQLMEHNGAQTPLLRVGQVLSIP
jgi:LysM repeat protein